MLVHNLFFHVSIHSELMSITTLASQQGTPPTHTQHISPATQCIMLLCTCMVNACYALSDSNCGADNYFLCSYLPFTNTLPHGHSHLSSNQCYSLTKTLVARRLQTKVDGKIRNLMVSEKHVYLCVSLTIRNTSIKLYKRVHIVKVKQKFM